MQTEISQLRERFDAIASQMNKLMHKQSVESPALTKTVDSGVRQAKRDETKSADRPLPTMSLTIIGQVSVTV